MGKIVKINQTPSYLMISNIMHFHCPKVSGRAGLLAFLWGGVLLVSVKIPDTSVVVYALAKPSASLVWGPSHAQGLARC